MAFNFYAEIEKLQKNAKVLTENGAVGYVTTGKALLDMNFKVASYRNKSEDEILVDYVKAFAEDPELAVKWMFYAGDVREGLGERRLFRILLKYVVPRYKNLIPLIAEYNRFDSLFELFDTDAEADMIAFVQKQLHEDLQNALADKPVSLLAKWMPSVNTSSEKTRALAHRFIAALGMNDKKYRKMLSSLRAKIGVLETQLCADEWKDVNYEAVPSQANLKYKNAFLKHDETRRREFLEKAVKGEVKMNSSVLFPHDIVHRYCGHYTSADPALEALWKNLPNMVDSDKPVIVVRDGSGSMETPVDPNSHTSALDVATALAIYFAERCSPEYKDKFITFSAHPKFVNLSGFTTLSDKLKVAYHEAECSNTNIEAVFNLLLKVAVNAGVPHEEIPTILIISDMEFDGCVGGDETTSQWGRCSAPVSLFEKIGKVWKAHGYTLPKVVFWNVNSRSDAIPLRQNEQGVALVSGFSANICKMVCSNELDPFKALKDVLLSDRYAAIHLN